MGEAFIHEALENMLLFIRKPSKPRVRLTKRSIMAYENAKKYYNLAIKLKDKYYERCSDSLLETLQKMELKLKNADEIYNKILKK
jgi:hypothetical protein